MMMMMRYIRLIVWADVMDTRGPIISADGFGQEIRHSRKVARLCETKLTITMGTTRSLV